MSLNWIDFLIIGVIALSVAVSLIRGFIREALSLTTWIVALWAAISFFESSAEFFTPWIAAPSARMAVAFVAIFLVVLVAGAIVNSVVSGLVRKTGLSGTDRVIGILFGFARGVVIVALLVLSAGLTALPQELWWRESRMLGHFQELAVRMRDFLPAEISKNIRYEEDATMYEFDQ